MLSSAEKIELYQRGYVRIAGLIPRQTMDAALRAINASVGRGMNEGDMPRYHAQGFCSDSRSTPVITDLFNKTPAFALVESLLGAGNILPVNDGQVALRFPTMAEPTGLPRPHIDGTYPPNNGVEPGKLENFTLLVGCFLSDVKAPLSGNFMVWPGSHRAHAEYFARHGPEALLQGMPAVDLGEGVQVQVNAGDVVLAQYLLGHTVAPNTSPHIRYTVFFRIHAREMPADRFRSMTEPWAHWPGMSDVGGEMAR